MLFVCYFNNPWLDTIFNFCIDMINGTVGDMAAMGVTESYLVKRQVLISAAEAAEMLLRVDDIISCAPRPRQRDHGH